MPFIRVPWLVRFLYPRGAWRAPGPDSPAYLTFDDGPHPVHTREILRILDEAGVPGHFFMTGRNAREYPGIVRELAAAGHVVGSHGERHVSGRMLDAAGELRNYVQGCGTLERLIGAPVRLVRPTHGRIRVRTARALRRRGLRVVLYDTIPYDYREPDPDVIMARTVRAVRNGSIVLLHDGGGDRSRTVAALPGILRALGGRCAWARLEERL